MYLDGDGKAALRLQEPLERRSGTRTASCGPRYHSPRTFKDHPSRCAKNGGMRTSCDVMSARATPHVAGLDDLLRFVTAGTADLVVGDLRNTFPELPRLTVVPPYSAPQGPRRVVQDGVEGEPVLLRVFEPEGDKAGRVWRHGKVSCVDVSRGSKGALFATASPEGAVVGPVLRVKDESEDFNRQWAMAKNVLCPWKSVGMKVGKAVLILLSDGSRPVTDYAEVRRPPTFAFWQGAVAVGIFVLDVLLEKCWYVASAAARRVCEPRSEAGRGPEGGLGADPGSSPDDTGASSHGRGSGEEVWKTLAIVALSAPNMYQCVKNTFESLPFAIQSLGVLFTGSWLACYTLFSVPFMLLTGFQSASPRRRPLSEPEVSSLPFLLQTTIGFWDVLRGRADLRASARSKDEKRARTRSTRRVVVGLVRLILPLVAAGWLVPDRWYYFGPF